MSENNTKQENPNEEDVSENQKNFLMQARDWAKKNKRVLFAGATGAIVFVLGLFLVKNPDAIDNLFSSNSSTEDDPTENVPPTINSINEESPHPVLPEEILNNLTGNKLTATGLGRMVGLSPQEINKRLQDAGLECKHPCGEYILTEEGQRVGTRTVKVPSSGHTFANNEWDEKVLEVICPEELKKIEARKAQNNRTDVA